MLALLAIVALASRGGEPEGRRAPTGARPRRPSGTTSTRARSSCSCSACSCSGSCSGGGANGSWPRAGSRATRRSRASSSLGLVIAAVFARAGAARQGLQPPAAGAAAGRQGRRPAAEPVEPDRHEPEFQWLPVVLPRRRGRDRDDTSSSASAAAAATPARRSDETFVARAGRGRGRRARRPARRAGSAAGRDRRVRAHGADARRARDAAGQAEAPLEYLDRVSRAAAAAAIRRRAALLFELRTSSSARSSAPQAVDAGHEGGRDRDARTSLRDELREEPGVSEPGAGGTGCGRTGLAAPALAWRPCSPWSPSQARHGSARRGDRLPALGPGRLLRLVLRRLPRRSARSHSRSSSTSRRERHSTQQARRRGLARAALGRRELGSLLIVRWRSPASFGGVLDRLGIRGADPPDLPEGPQGGAPPAPEAAPLVTSSPSMVGGVGGSSPSGRCAGGGAARSDRFSEDLSSLVEETLDDLRDEPDVRLAIVRAYARMERVLERSGVPREEAEAPLEYVARVLLELDVRPAPVHALTELFERAKFSAHPWAPRRRTGHRRARGRPRRPCRRAAAGGKLAAG